MGMLHTSTIIHGTEDLCFLMCMELALEDAIRGSKMLTLEGWDMGCIMKTAEVIRAIKGKRHSYRLPATILHRKNYSLRFH